MTGTVGYLKNNLSNPQLFVENVSKQTGVSKGPLYTKLLEETGETPVDYSYYLFSRFLIRLSERLIIPKKEEN